MIPFTTDTVFGADAGDLALVMSAGYDAFHGQWQPAWNAIYLQLAKALHQREWEIAFVRPDDSLRVASILFRAKGNPPAWTLWLAGIRTTAHLQGIVGGWNSPMSYPGVGLVNYFYGNGARLLQQDFVNLARAEGGELFVFGHSGGGAVAEVFSCDRDFLSRFQKVRVMTCGGPKTSLTIQHGSTRDVEFYRVMNNDDPVCNLPDQDIMQITSLPGIRFLNGSQSITWTHRFPGLLLGQWGTVSDSMITTGTGGTFALPGIINDYQLTDRIFGHDLPTYARRLKSLPPAEEPRQLYILPFNVGDQVQVETIDGRERETKVFALTVAGGPGEKVKKNMATIDPDWALKVVPDRNGGATLLWMNVRLASFASIGSAKASARAWNRLLRRMLTKGIWSSVNLLDAMQVWLRGAANPVTGATKPVLVLDDVGL